MLPEEHACLARYQILNCIDENVIIAWSVRLGALETEEEDLSTERRSVMNLMRDQLLLDHLKVNSMGHENNSVP
jgi:hypothetical protein